MAGEKSGVGGLGGRGEGIKQYELAVTKYSGEVKYSIGNTVSIVITLHGARWVLEI